MKIEQRNQTDVERWDVEEILDSINDGKMKKASIKVPTFQRNLTWSKTQKDLFIDSLKKGFPIGSLLLYEKIYEDSRDHEKKRYLLVDGLQRSNAIKEYSKHPTRFFLEEDINDEFVKSAIDKIKKLKNKTLSHKDTKEFIYNWIHEKSGLEESDGYSGYSLASDIDENFEIDLSKQELKELASTLIQFIEEIKKEADINNLKLPVLIFRGDINFLPEIFKRINKQGTQLNKYQIFAAVWEDRGVIEIKNKNIRDKIKEKYDSLVDGGFIVEGYSENLKEFHTSKFNYFEYVFGLGKYLTSKEEFKYLFHKSNKLDESESIGFNLVSACLIGNVKEIDEIPSALKKLDVSLFEDVLIDSINEVRNNLKPFIEIKTNKKNNASNVKVYHTEMQIVAIIAKVFRNKFDDSLKERPDWKTRKEELLNNLKFYYLYDIIDDAWRGSGDTEVNNILKVPSRYDYKLYKEDWDSKLDDWFETQLKEETNDRKSIKNDQMLFLNYIYSHTHSCYRTMSSVEDQIEHIVTINKLKAIKPAAMNCIANLGLLESKVNISKKDYTIFEYYNIMYNDLKNISDFQNTNDKNYKRYCKNHLELQNIKDQNDLKEFIDESKKNAENDFFINEGDLNFTTSINKGSYEDFLRYRFGILKQKFYNSNKIPKK